MKRTLLLLAIVLGQYSCKSLPNNGSGALDAETNTVQGQSAIKPNIVLLMLDDLHDEQYLPFWQAMPDLKGMVDEGLWFKNMFGPSPICCPGRVTALSGLLGHNSGVFTIAGPYGAEEFPKGDKLNRTMAVYLEKLGYENVLFGKSWKTPKGSPSAQSIEPGWFEWHELGGDKMYQGYDYILREGVRGGPVSDVTYKKRNEYSTFVIGSKAGRYVKERWNPNKGPFFMWLSPTVPHLPLDGPTHDLKDNNIDYKGIALKRWGQGSQQPFPEQTQPNFGEKDPLDGKPQWLKNQASLREKMVRYVREEYPRRMGSMMGLNKMMQDLRSDMKSKTLQDGTTAWDHTIFIVTSDNGYNNGAHRLIHKMAPYEESLRVPLYVFGPGVAKGEISALVGLHDLAPTIIELAGGNDPEAMDGHSFATMLRTGQKTHGWREELVGEYRTGGVNPGEAPDWSRGNAELTRGWKLDVPSYKVLRTEQFSYIEWANDTPELYDIIADKWQQKNLLFTEPHQHDAVVKQMQGRLNELALCTGKKGAPAQDGQPARVPCP